MKFGRTRQASDHHLELVLSAFNLPFSDSRSRPQTAIHQWPVRGALIRGSLIGSLYEPGACRTFVRVFVRVEVSRLQHGAATNHAAAQRGQGLVDLCQGRVTGSAGRLPWRARAIISPISAGAGLAGQIPLAAIEAAVAAAAVGHRRELL